MSKFLKRTMNVTMNTNAICQQFLINSLKLPYDITNEINSYLFYDKDATNKRNEFRTNISHEILKGFNSRNRTKYGETQLHDEYLIVDYGKKCTFSGIYCEKCGENITIGLTDTRVWCSFCKRQLEDTCYFGYAFHDYYLFWRHLRHRQGQCISIIHAGLFISEIEEYDDDYDEEHDDDYDEEHDDDYDEEYGETWIN